MLIPYGFARFLKLSMQQHGQSLSFAAFFPPHAEIPPKC